MRRRGGRRACLSAAAVPGTRHAAGRRRSSSSPLCFKIACSFDTQPGKQGALAPLADVSAGAASHTQLLGILHTHALEAPQCALLAAATCARFSAALQ